MVSTYLEFWGKAGGERPGEPESHPLAYHCLDVAAVADVLLRANPRRLAALSRWLGTTPDRARTFLVTLIALHDIGKFAAPFQAKCTDFYPTSLPIAVHRDELEKYDISKGTIRFAAEKPLPAALVRKLVMTRIAAIRSKVVPAKRKQERVAGDPRR